MTVSQETDIGQVNFLLPAIHPWMQPECLENVNQCYITTVLCSHFTKSQVDSLFKLTWSVCGESCLQQGQQNGKQWSWEPGFWAQLWCLYYENGITQISLMPASCRKIGLRDGGASISWPKPPQSMDLLANHQADNSPSLMREKFPSCFKSTFPLQAVTWSSTP